MKLNLWLIANQLADKYDIETKISASTQRTISGPLPVESTETVYIRNEGQDVICHMDQGTILIRDVGEKEGFLLIQSIFNWYDNWADGVGNALRMGDYRHFVHLCAQAFSNPVILQDSNSLLLGMDCRGLPVTVIPEWRFLYETEQSSVDYYLAMTDAINHPVRKYNDSVYRFDTRAKDENGQDYQTKGMLAKFRFLGRDYGQLTVLDKKRPLNPGDAALLMYIADLSSVLLAAVDSGENSSVNRQFMNDLLEYRNVPDEQMEYQYSIITRSANEKQGRLCLILFRNTAEQKKDLIDLFSTVLEKQYPALYTWTYRGDLLSLVYVPEPDIFAEQLHSFVKNQGYAKYLHIGVSLPFDDLGQLPFYYEQAVYAVKHDSKRHLRFFYDCAYRYLLENIDLPHKLEACEPSCRRMWENEPEKREFLLTLSVYLGAERSSSLAAEMLYIHRNTVNYRIRYLKEHFEWDIEQTFLRDYLRLSIFYLNHQ